MKEPSSPHFNLIPIQ